MLSPSRSASAGVKSRSSGDSCKQLGPPRKPCARPQQFQATGLQLLFYGLGSACREPAIHSARLQQPLADFAGGGIGGGGQGPHSARCVGGRARAAGPRGCAVPAAFHRPACFPSAWRAGAAGPSSGSGIRRSARTPPARYAGREASRRLPRANAALSPRSSTGAFARELLAQALADQPRRWCAPARLGVGAQLVRVRVAQPVQHGRAVQRA